MLKRMPSTKGDHRFRFAEQDNRPGHEFTAGPCIQPHIPVRINPLKVEAMVVQSAEPIEAILFSEGTQVMPVQIEVMDRQLISTGPDGNPGLMGKS